MNTLIFLGESVGVVLTAFFILAASRRAITGVGALLITYFGATAYFGIPPYYGIPPVFVGVNVFWPDALCTLLLISGAVRIFTSRNRPLQLTDMPWLAFGAVMFISLLLGIETYGVGVAVTAARSTYYFWSCAFYLGTFYLSDLEIRQIFRWITGIAIGFSALVLFRWVSDFAGLSQYYVIGTYRWRVVSSTEAFVIGIAAVWLLISHLSRPSRTKLFGVLALLLVVLILQHRSAWLSTCAGLVAVILTGAKSQSRILKLATSLLILLFLAWIYAGQSSLGQSLGADLNNSVSAAENLYDGTSFARIETWRVLSERWQQADSSVWLIGFPYGTPMTRYVGAAVAEFSAHNFYVETLFDNGLVGELAVLLCITVLVMRSVGSSKAAPRDIAIHQMSVAFLCSMLVYFITYGAGYIHGILIGIAISSTLAAKRPKARKVLSSLYSFKVSKEVN